MAQRPLRLALCGLGMAAQVVYLPLLARRRDLFEVVAVCDRSDRALEALGTRLGLPAEDRCTAVADVAARDDVDAALLLTSGSHGHDSRALLAAGKAVLCEKPLAYTRAEARALEPTDRLQVGYMKLFDPAVVAAVGAVDQVGPVRSVEVTVLHPSPERQLHHLGGLPAPWPVTDEVRAQTRELTHRLRVQALGEAAAAEVGALYTDVLLGSVVHDLAVLRALVGDPAAVDRADRWEVEAGVSVAVDGRLASGARWGVRWHLLPHYPSYREQVRVHGERGTVALEFPSPYLLHAPTELQVVVAEGDDEHRWQRSSHAEAFEHQLEAFASVASGHAPPRSGVADGLTDIVTCQRVAAALAAARDVPIAGEAAEP